MYDSLGKDWGGGAVVRHLFSGLLCSVHSCTRKIRSCPGSILLSHLFPNRTGTLMDSKPACHHQGSLSCLFISFSFSSSKFYFQTLFFHFSTCTCREYGKQTPRQFGHC
jgi:hypothetical protein